MAFKIDIQKFALSILFSLITITILSLLISNYTDVPTIKTGKAFFLVAFGVAITLLFSISKDFKIEKGEILLFIIVVFTLIATMFGMKQYFPELFNIFPSPTKDLFSAVIG